MCLQKVRKKQTISQKNAITAWKEMQRVVGNKTVGITYVPSYQTCDIVFKRGLNTSKHPGFHVHLDKKEALNSTRDYRRGHGDRDEYKIIKVKIWGRVRFGEQWNTQCASATNMEIVNFTNHLRYR